MKILNKKVKCMVAVSFLLISGIGLFNPSQWGWATNVALLSPLNGAVLDDNTPLLEWSDPGVGVVNYHLQLWYRANPGTYVIDDNTLPSDSLSYQVSSPLADDEYSWRVNFKSKDWGDWSRTFNFTILTVLPVFDLTPTLSLPVNGATIEDTTPMFSWYALRGANQYHLQVSESDIFSTLEINVTTDSTEYTASSPLSQDQQFWWKVRAKNDTTTFGAWSSVGSFTILTALPVFDLTPTLSLPVNRATIEDTTPTFSWYDLHGATQFHLQVSESDTFSTLEINATTDSTYYTASSPLSQDQQFWWRVRAKNDTTTFGAWSSVRTFVIPAPDYWDLTGSPILIDNDGGTTGAMTWSEVVVEPWCTYTEGVYYIEKVIIDGQGTGSCITIKDSTVPFVINDCQLSNAGSVTYDSGIYLESVTNGTIINCNISACQNTGILLYGDCLYNEIAHNLLTYNVGNVIHIRLYSHHNSVKNNTICYGDNQAIRTYHYCQHISISDNIIYNQTVGIFLHESYNGTCVNNTIYNCTKGIYVRYAHDNALYLNNLTANNNYGLEVHGSRNLEVSHNTFSHTAFDGIRLRDTTRYCSLHDNNITQSNRYGLFIDNINAINNTISENRFTANMECNGYDNGTGNNWDGNLWSDYVTRLGALAKDANDDWIGDSHYPINGSAGTVDNLPIYWDPIVFTILTPTPLSPVGTSPPSFTFDILEGIADTIQYSFDGGTTIYELPGDHTIPPAVWNTVSDGEVTVDIMMTDSEGIPVVEQVTLLKESKVPIIEILSPTSSDEFGESAPTFEITIEDENFSCSWYTLDVGATNISCGLTGSLDTDIWESLADGSVTVTFYANDTYGNIGSAQVIISKNTQAPHTLSDPRITYPNGGETLEGIIQITWEATVDSWDHDITYDLYYSHDGGTSWVLIIEGVAMTSYNCDTTAIPDGDEYVILVVARCSGGLETDDVSDGVFTIFNPVVSSSETDTASSTESSSSRSFSQTKPQEGPGYTILPTLTTFTLLSISVVILRKRRKNV